MKLLSTALLAAGLASLAGCGGGAANNAASANNVVEALPPIDNGSDLNSLPPAALNASNAAATNAAAGNAAATNATAATNSSGAAH
jgi:hypothetical protein